MLFADLRLFYENIFIYAKFSEKPVRLICPGVKFSLFPALVPETLPLVINIPSQPSLHGTIRTGKFQVISGIKFVEFESESVHVTFKKLALPDQFSILVKLLHSMHGNTMCNTVFVKHME